MSTVSTASIREIKEATWEEGVREKSNVNFPDTNTIYSTLIKKDINRQAMKWLPMKPF